MANSVSPCTCQSHVWTGGWGGTLLAMSAQRPRVDERPLTSDWFPIERLMDSPVLHVCCLRGKVWDWLRKILMMRGDYSDRTLRRKEMLKGLCSRHIVRAGNQVLLFWGNVPEVIHIYSLGILLCTVNSKKWLSSTLYTILIEVNRSNFIYITPSMTRSGDHHILSLHPRVLAHSLVRCDT